MAAAARLALASLSFRGWYLALDDAAITLLLQLYHFNVHMHVLLFVVVSESDSHSTI
jgi:hypothetical protein